MSNFKAFSGLGICLVFLFLGLAFLPQPGKLSSVEELFATLWIALVLLAGFAFGRECRQQEQLRKIRRSRFRKSNRRRFYIKDRIRPSQGDSNRNCFSFQLSQRKDQKRYFER